MLLEEMFLDRVDYSDYASYGQMQERYIVRFNDIYAALWAITESCEEFLDSWDFEFNDELIQNVFNVMAEAEINNQNERELRQHIKGVLSTHRGIFENHVIDASHVAGTFYTDLIELIEQITDHLMESTQLVVGIPRWVRP